MPTIKNFKFEKGKPLSTDLMPHVQMPFKADNWKSTNSALDNLVKPTGAQSEPVAVGDPVVAENAKPVKKSKKK